MTPKERKVYQQGYVDGLRAAYGRVTDYLDHAEIGRMIEAEGEQE